MNLLLLLVTLMAVHIHVVWAAVNLTLAKRKGR